MDTLTLVHPITGRTLAFWNFGNSTSAVTRGRRSPGGRGAGNTSVRRRAPTRRRSAKKLAASGT